MIVHGNEAHVLQCNKRTCAFLSCMHLSIEGHNYVCRQCDYTPAAVDMLEDVLKATRHQVNLVHGYSSSDISNHDMYAGESDICSRQNSPVRHARIILGCQADAHSCRCQSW